MQEDLIDGLLDELILSKERIKELEGERQDWDYSYDCRICEILSNKPLKVKGIALKEGRWKTVFYPAEEIKKAAKSLIGKPIVLDHGKGIKDVVGEVTASYWDEKLRALRFEADIISDEIGELIRRGLVKQVSTGSTFDPKETKSGLTAFNIDFYELALTLRPACPDGIKEILSLDKPSERIINIEKRENKEGGDEMSNNTREEDKASEYTYTYPDKKYKDYKYPDYYIPKGAYGLDKITKIIKAIVKALKDKKILSEDFDLDSNEFNEEEAAEIKCPVCGKVFKTKEDFEEHWEKEHAEKYGKYGYYKKYDAYKKPKEEASLKEELEQAGQKQEEEGEQMEGKEETPKESVISPEEEAKRKAEEEEAKKKAEDERKAKIEEEVQARVNALKVELEKEIRHKIDAELKAKADEEAKIKAKEEEEAKKRAEEEKRVKEEQEVKEKAETKVKEEKKQEEEKKEPPEKPESKEVFLEYAKRIM